MDATSCQTFATNAASHALVHSLGNFLRTLETISRCHLDLSVWCNTRIDLCPTSYFVDRYRGETPRLAADRDGLRSTVRRDIGE